MTYFICFVQRCGSNLLCEALSRKGIAGRPSEVFLPDFPEAEVLGVEIAGFEQSLWARRRGITAFSGFLRSVRCEHSTANGVFGAKIAWNSFGSLVDKLGGVPEYSRLAPPQRVAAAFEHPRFIHLRRRDRVRQAVSWALAAQTGYYSSSQASARPRLREPSFDIELLDGLSRLIREGDQRWTAFFEDIHVEPLRLFYEDMVGDLAGTVRAILTWLGFPVPEVLDPSELANQRQSTQINEDWVARYRELRPRA